MPKFLRQLKDVSVSSPADGQVLTYASGGWVNDDAAGGGSLPAEWTVADNGGLQITPSDASESGLNIKSSNGKTQIVSSDGATTLSVDTGEAFSHDVLSASASALYIYPPDTNQPIRLSDYTNGDNLIEVVDPGKLGFFGATAVTQPAAPTTLADVIAALKALGLVAT